MRLAGQVTLEAVLVTTLLLTHLAIPSQLLQTLGFDSVGNLHQGKKDIGGPDVCRMQQIPTPLQVAIQPNSTLTALGLRKSFFPMAAR